MSVTEMAFSTRTVSGSDPIELMTEHVGRHLMRLDISLPGGVHDLDYRYTLFGSRSALWGKGATTPIRYERSAELLTDGNDDVALALLDQPIKVIKPSGESFVVPPGDALLISQARRYSYELPRSASGWTLQFKHADIKALVPEIEEAPLKAIHGRTPGMLLMRSYLEAAAAERFSDPMALETVGLHLLQLGAIAISRPFQASKQDVSRGLNAARIEVIIAELQAHLTSPQLDLDWVARRQRLSPRQIQRLFASRGTSFSDELRRLRLARAAQMLANPAFSKHSILTIALDVGFSDAPTFNRAFKRHFGLTPGDLRRTHEQDNS